MQRFILHSKGLPFVREDKGEPRILPPEQAAEVEAVWSAAQAHRGPALFNGEIFSVDAIEGVQVHGRFVEYKWYLAARAQAHLYHALCVRPLAVTGILRCADGIVFGRRGRAVTQDQELLELVPSGGLSRQAQKPNGSLNPVAQVLAELQEEVGLDRDQIVRVRPLYTIEDTHEHLVDIVIELVTMLSAAAVEAGFRASRRPEYSALRVVATDDCAAFLAASRQEIAPLTAYILQSL